MATIPFWAIGKHVTAFTIIPQTANASTGVLSDVTGYTTIGAVYGHLDSVEIAQDTDRENISSMDSTQKNEVPIEYGTTYDVEEIAKSVGVNKLANLVNSGYNHFKVTLTRGAQTWTGYAGIGNFRSRMSKRRVIESWNLVPIQVVDGTTTANPIYS